ncbi:MAG: proline racemase family protein [Bacteroidales bacterium]|nr:proline racemase family protein [Bacteroidales bacterium]
MYKKLKDLNWKPPVEWMKISTIDMHTGGEPLRILVSGYPKIKGDTILEKRKYFRNHLDHIRKGIMWEPRGHADMYGAVVTEPCSKDADFGTFFLHNEGYSTMCGHAIIALTKFVLDTKLIRRKGDRPTIKIDAPPGRIISTGIREDGVVKSVSFRNVPSFVLHRDQLVQVPGLGRVRYDVAFGGAFYVIVEADTFGLSLETSEYSKLIDLGKRIKKTVMNNQKITHPFEEDLSFLYGTIFTGKSFNPSRHSRNVCVFANGEVDRSATGSGLSARAALHHARGDLKMGEKIVIESILGSTMEVEMTGLTTFGPHKAIIPVVSGTASFTGGNKFWFDPADPLKDGFIFR